MKGTENANTHSTKRATRNSRVVGQTMQRRQRNVVVSVLSEEFVDIQRAKAVCSKCSSQAECLLGALDRAEPWGVWGGELLEEGRICVTKRPRGRPVTRNIRVTVVDEVPIPGTSWHKTTHIKTVYRESTPAVNNLFTISSALDTVMLQMLASSSVS